MDKFRDVSVKKCFLTLVPLFIFVLGMTEINQENVVLSAESTTENYELIEKCIENQEGLMEKEPYTKSEDTCESLEISEQKKLLIEEYTNELQNVEKLKVIYNVFIDEFHCVYIVKDEIDKEKILVVQVEEQKVRLLFKAGDLDGGDFKEPLQPILHIQKLKIDYLDNSSNPTICVFRSNEEYTKVQVFEIKEEGVRHLGSYERNTETGEDSGDKEYEYLLGDTITWDYCDEAKKSE